MHNKHLEWLKSIADTQGQVLSAVKEQSPLNASDPQNCLRVLRQIEAHLTAALDIANASGLTSIENARDGIIDSLDDVRHEISCYENWGE